MSDKRKCNMIDEIVVEIEELLDGIIKDAGGESVELLDDIVESASTIMEEYMKRRDSLKNED